VVPFLRDKGIFFPKLLKIICVLNVEANSDIRNKLPSPLLYSTIYHKVGDIPDEDIEMYLIQYLINIIQNLKIKTKKKPKIF